MAGAQGVRAGRAYVEIGGDDSSLRNVLAGAAQRFQSFSTAVLKVGAAAVAATGVAVGAAVASFVSAGSALNDMAARTGASVEGLSELGFAAKLSGTSIEAVETAFRKSAKVITEAAGGSKEAAKALATLGISAKELQGLKPDEQFRRISTALNAISDPTAKAAAAMAVFGKSGTQLLPMIADMDKLTARARELGIVMSAEDVAAADALGDAFDTVQAAVGGLSNSIAVVFAPALTFVANALADLIGSVTAFARTYQEMFTNVIIDAVAVVITAVSNWRLSLKTAIVTVELAVVRFGNQLEHMFFYGVDLLIFFADNWRDTFTDIWNYTWTVLKNLKDNFLNFFNFIAAWLSGEEYDFQWIALESGFVRTLKKLPELAAREMGPLEKSLQTELDALAGQLVEKFDETKKKIVDMAAGPVKDSVQYVSKGPQLAAAEVATKAALALKFAGADRFGSAGALSAQGRSGQEQREKKQLQIIEESKRLLQRIHDELRSQVQPQVVKI